MLKQLVNLLRSIGRLKKFKKFNNNFLVIYRNLSMNFNEIKTIPQCDKPSIFEYFLSFLRWDKAMLLHEIVDEKHRKMGPIYRDQIGPVKAIFVNSPEDYRKIFRLDGATPKHFLPESWMVYNEIRQCRRGLLFMDGEEWLYFRRIMNRLMLLPNVTSNIIVESCQDAAVALTEEWTNQIQHNSIIKGLERRLYQWSIEVMIATLLGSSWKYYKENIAQGESEKLAQVLHQIFVLTAKLSLLPIKYAIKLRLPVWQEFVKVADEALGSVQSLVPEMTRLQGNGLLHLMQKEGVEDYDLTRIITDLIIAAGDTTAYSTQWALFLLAKHPKVQEIIAEKIKYLNPKEIINDPYLKGVIKESLRLYPTAPFLTRILPEKNLIGGYEVLAGELLVMSVYSSGRDPKNFAQPNEFMPERWIRNEKNNYDKIYNPYGSIPFALGARSCIGKKLAEAQMILIIAELVKNFKIACPNAEEIKMILHMISVPSQTIQLQLTSRKTI